jgi:predicted nucleic acid-binding protein
VASESVATSALAIAEMASTLGRRVREGGVPFELAEASFAQFLRDMAEFTVLDLDRPLLMDTTGMLRRGSTGSRLRTLDAIHLAAARAARVVASRQAIVFGVFVSADHVLLEAARWAGLTTVNPEDHP